MVLGLRSVPGVAGGVETHCERLYPLVASAGADVEVVVRSQYASPAAGRSWNGLRITPLWSPSRSGVEAFVHTFFGVLYAAIRRPDVLHVHAIGPGIFTPLAKALGLTVVVTHHGSNYESAKWGPLGKRILKTGERMSMRYADAVVSVSRSKAADLLAEYGREADVIPNGVPPISAPGSHPVLGELGLESGRYLIHVGRCAAEKRQDVLIDAFVRAGLPGWKLVLVGDLSGQDPYSQRVRARAAGAKDVVLAGYREGEALWSLLAHAGCFALPSTIEGFSIALLEALSAGCPVIASDIPANHEVELPASSYFPVNDVDAFARALRRAPELRRQRVWGELQGTVQAAYGWSRVASQIVEVYERLRPDRRLRSAPLRPTPANDDGRAASPVRADEPKGAVRMVPGLRLIAEADPASPEGAPAVASTTVQPADEPVTETTPERKRAQA